MVNYSAPKKFYIDSDPSPCMGEVKDVLRHYILGMGDVDLKHPKSLCLVGPPKCGKKLMVDVLANELGTDNEDSRNAMLYECSNKNVH